MTAKPRVHEIASELGIDSKEALGVLKAMGEFVKSPSSTIEPAVARKLRAAVHSGVGPITSGDALDATLRSFSTAATQPSPGRHGVQRVFDIANEHRIDTRQVLDTLGRLGARGLTETSRVPPHTLPSLRRALGGPANTNPAFPRAHHPELRERTVRAPKRQTRAYRLHGQDRQRFRDRLTSLIPEIYSALIDGGRRSEASTIILCSQTDGASNVTHQICTMDGEQINDLDAKTASRTMKPLQDLYATYQADGAVPPSAYIGVDLQEGHAWVARSLSSVRRRSNAIHAADLSPVPPNWRPAMLAPKGQVMNAAQAIWVKGALGSGPDRPEETFLISDDLLHLAVESVSTAPPLMPMPVHTNAVWVFARPVIMTLPDGMVRGVRAIWFRQGGTMWRLRTYVGSTTKFSQVGPQLSGRVPFEPVWDAQHPEQQVLAAVWALMAQGGVTESRTEFSSERRGHAGQPHARDELTIVDVKPGTPHAKYYSTRVTPGAERPAWSVRGHWRRQPYPSLGVDENGDVRTQMIWIATYTKGSSDGLLAPKKVLRVGAGG